MSSKQMAALVLIALGTFFLLSNLGILQVSLADLLSTWWPLVLIGAGLMLFLSKDKKSKPELKK